VPAAAPQDAACRPGREQKLGDRRHGYAVRALGRVTAFVRPRGKRVREFGARNLVMADHVHPTAFGQIAIAERALDLLAADGMTVKVRPSSLIHYETTRFGRLRGDLTYAYRHAKVSARAAYLAARPGRSRAA
jgi:hypothetical protein